MNNRKTPRIRFRGFTDDWEQRKFSDLVETRRGLTYKPADIREIGVRVLRSSNIDEDCFVRRSDDIFVDVNAINIGFAKENDILITAANGSSRLVGKHTILSDIPDKSTVHGGFMLLGTSEEAYFANALMSSTWYKKFIDLYVLGGNGAIGNLNKRDLDEQDIFIPTKKEQQVIGNYFANLDHLITLHQRKLEKLKIVKKAMLENCFPKNGEKVPKFRFSGFTGDWEQRKLGEMIKEVTRTDESSEAPVMMITANDGFINQSERYSTDNAGQSLKKYILLHKGELAYNHGASKLRPYGSCFALTTEKNARIPFVYHCFSTDTENPEFLSLVLNGKMVEWQLRKIVSSGARMDGLLNISYEEYTSIPIMMPERGEQNKIANFFRGLDHLITLHQRKLEKLKIIKKSFLEKMFV